MPDPGGWAWTDLPGGVPDADDTPGALMALRVLDPNGKYSLAAGQAAVSWLLGLQNRDGGIPTFCRGWGKLPFDKSCSDLTAHALAAWSVWKPFVNKSIKVSINKAIKKGLNFLIKAQRSDGSWVPLWFGNEHAQNMENPVYGTAKVLIHLSHMNLEELTPVKDSCVNGLEWLLSVQKGDGSWGGDESAPATIEETALALDAIAGCAVIDGFFDDSGDDVKKTILTGSEALIEMIKKYDTLPASPIGLYFARLWYHEKLYPLIFSLSALRKARQVLIK